MPNTADRSAIADLYGAYCDAVNRRDGDQWIACWDADATWHFKDRTITGAPEIRQIWETAMTGYSDVHFFSQIGHLDVSGNRATARAYTLEFIRTQSGEARTQIGEYDDELICEQGRWRFARRSFRIREQR